MKRTHKLWQAPQMIGRLGLLAVFAATTVFAQGETPKPAPKKAEVRFKKGSQLTAAEQLAQAGRYMTTMKVTLGRVNRLARRARADKDLIKLNCVNDKRVRIKGNMRVADNAHNGLKTAASRNDDGARSHEFSKMTIVYQKVTVLGQEAEACIGEEISYVGKGSVTVDVDPDVARQGDPTIDALPPLPTIRPPMASPFR